MWGIIMYKNSNTVIANEKIDHDKIAWARKIILELYNELPDYIKKGCGPFLAAIYDGNGRLIAKSANTVIHDKCSNNHAEINTIRMAEKALKNHDLSSQNASLFVTAEPCMMCLGGIMWSGIKNVYFGVTSNDVENITGFDEGIKPNWMSEFKKRGINVYGSIEPEIGKSILQNYVSQQHVIYKPKRNG